MIRNSRSSFLSLEGALLLGLCYAAIGEGDGTRSWQTCLGGLTVGRRGVTAGGGGRPEEKGGAGRGEPELGQWGPSLGKEVWDVGGRMDSWGKWRKKLGNKGFQEVFLHYECNS